MHALGRWAAVLTATFSLAAAAEDRIAIVKFEGGGATKLRAQLSKALCRANKCVVPGRAGKKVSVDAVIGGKVKGAGARRSLELMVYTSEDGRAVKRKLPLDRKGLLAKRTLWMAVSAVKTSLQSVETEESDESDTEGSLAIASDTSTTE
jgi:hypothetical protein